MSSSASARILYIEDDAGLAALVQRRLMRIGFSVDTVTNGEQGLEKVRTGAYAVVLIDYKLPGQPFQGQKLYTRITLNMGGGQLHRSQLKYRETK